MERNYLNNSEIQKYSSEFPTATDNMNIKISWVKFQTWSLRFDPAGESQPPSLVILISGFYNTDFALSGPSAFGCYYPVDGSLAASKYVHLPGGKPPSVAKCWISLSEKNSDVAHFLGRVGTARY